MRGRRRGVYDGVAAGVVGRDDGFHAGFEEEREILGDFVEDGV